MNKKIIKLAIAGIVYAGFAFYLYRPHFHNLSFFNHLIPVNLFFGALGCFIVSKRWIGNFAAEFSAGALYGFGPFLIGMSPYHPFAGALAASIPWLFWPAVFLTKDKLSLLKILLYILPFVMVLLFFQLAARFGFFPVPLGIKLHPADLLGFVSDLAAAKMNLTLIGFYHVPLAAMIMGAFMIVIARRYLLLSILIVGIIGGFCSSVLTVSPVIWISVSAFCLAILIGIGLKGLTVSGPADGKFLVAIICSMIALAAACALLSLHCDSYFAGIAAGFANLFRISAKMHLAAASVVTMIYLFAKLKISTHWIRWAILISAVAVDIFFSARFIVDSGF